MDSKLRGFKNRPRLSAALWPVAILLSGCAHNHMPTVQKPESSIEQSMWAQYTKDADEAARQGRKAEAESLYKQAIAAAERLGQRNANLPRTLSNMADFYYAQGDGDRADQLYKRAIALREKAAGTENKDIAKDLIGLARIRVSQGQKQEALPLYDRAISILRKSNQPVPPDVQKEYEEAGK